MKKTNMKAKKGKLKPKVAEPAVVERVPVRAEEPARVPVVCVKLEPSDPEFVDEWLLEQGLKEGKSWKAFFGDYDKEFCKVRLKDGTFAGPCWPNAGKFVRLEDEAEIPAGDVTHVMYYVVSHHVRTRDDDGDEDSGG